jgi:hypothetical protein
MERYTLSGEEHAAIKDINREFQAAVAVVANRLCGVEVTEPHGISSKHEGGVTVNNREIVIKEDFVRDIRNHWVDATKEEKATVDAIREVTKAFKEGGEEALKRIVHNIDMSKYPRMGTPVQSWSASA